MSRKRKHRDKQLFWTSIQQAREMFATNPSWIHEKLMNNQLRLTDGSLGDLIEEFRGHPDWLNTPRSLSDNLWGLPVAPLEEQEGAIKYLMAHVPRNHVQELLELIKDDKEWDSWIGQVHHGYGTYIRNLLRYGGFMWDPIVMDDTWAEVLKEAITRLKNGQPVRTVPQKQDDRFRTIRCEVYHTKFPRALEMWHNIRYGKTTGTNEMRFYLKVPGPLGYYYYVYKHLCDVWGRERTVKLYLHAITCFKPRCRCHEFIRGGGW